MSEEERLAQIEHDKMIQEYRLKVLISRETSEDAWREIRVKRPDVVKEWKWKSWDE